MKKNIAIASDHAGFEMKEALARELASLGHGVHDLGTKNTQSVDYPDFAHALANWMNAHRDSVGVLICGSGIGMSIAANRHAHIRAALVTAPDQAELARKHNDANVLCLGARIISLETAKACLAAFLNTAFEGGRHEARVKKL